MGLWPGVHSPNPGTTTESLWITILCRVIGTATGGFRGRRFIVSRRINAKVPSNIEPL